MYTKECRIEQIKGWGNFPKAEGKVFRPERVGDLFAVINKGDKTLLARGGGTSYGDASINVDGINIDTKRLNRMLHFDPQDGILHCQSGVTLEDIIKTFLVKGWFLNVTPGTQFATVGGCIACDSHGKNWKAGSFSNHIKGLRLMLHDGSIVCCDDNHNSDIFYATCGGMGMTGIILDVQLQLKRVRSSYVDVETLWFENLRELFDLLCESKESYEYNFAWVDSHKEGYNLGRGVLQRANHNNNECLFYKENWKVSVPFCMPSLAINKYSVNAFNSINYTMAKIRKSKKTIYLIQYFYPLDGVINWNNIYGKRGLIEYQIAIPVRDAYETIVSILKIVSKSKLASVVAAIKPIVKSKGLISFPINGYTLAIDFQYSTKVLQLLDKLDRIVVEKGGRVYLAKDARLSAKNFREMYSESLDSWEFIREKCNARGKFLSLMFNRFYKI